MAVRTTGIYCRPGCPAREPKRSNVRFYATASAAQRAGYRACKRCRPGDIAPDPKLALVEAACRYIDTHYDENVQLDALAEAVGVSGQTLQRAFLDILGLSPRAWTRARRLDQFRSELRDGSDVTRAIYGAGFGSPSRVYESAATDLGMTPADYARGGKATNVSLALGRTPFGVIGVGSTATGICSVRLGESEDAVEAAISAELPHASILRSTDTSALDRIVEHVVHGTSITDLPLDLQGTAFQRKVWAELRQIPRGQRRTYTEVAVKIGAPAAVRAVANACGANPAALVVPCHRVVRADGGLGGYRWGTERKETILTLEAQS
jgi:AraC family transcriptional regulator of adaptative response/methylated-DNA-[protein]-cysteine methyltransferase